MAVADLDKVSLCLQKIRSKNVTQNQDNLKNFLLKDYEYSPELAENLISCSNQYREFHNV